MEVIFLGTGSMMPTAERNHSAVLLTYEAEGILFDCGEGTQRQFRTAGISPTKVTKILISHWHGDHILGLPGLLQTLGACQYSGTLEIYGPKGTKEFVRKLMGSFILEGRVRMKVFDIENQVFFENEDFVLEALPMRHSTPCIAFAFVEKDKRRVNVDYLKKFGLKRHPILGKLQKGEDIEWEGRTIKAEDATIIRKGRKLAYVTDTRPCKNAVQVAMDADLLICEATLAADMAEQADVSGHMTSMQAAEIALDAGVKKLVLTHFSQRYKSAAKLEEEARKIFPNASAAKDFMRVNI